MDFDGGVFGESENDLGHGNDRGRIKSQFQVVGELGFDLGPQAGGGVVGGAGEQEFDRVQVGPVGLDLGGGLLEQGDQFFQAGGFPDGFGARGEALGGEVPVAAELGGEVLRFAGVGDCTCLQSGGRDETGVRFGS